MYTTELEGKILCVAGKPGILSENGRHGQTEGEKSRENIRKSNSVDRKTVKLSSDLK